MQSWDDEEYPSSLESLKQASASLDLHESASCSCLLPCGLLPEELEELEALGAGYSGYSGYSASASLASPGLKVEGAVSMVQGLSLAGAASDPSEPDDAPAPRTPTEAALQRAPAVARMLAPSDDDEASEADSDCSEGLEAAVEEATTPAIGGARAGASAAAS